MRYVRLHPIGFILSPRDRNDMDMKTPTHETIAKLATNLGNVVISAGFVDWKDGMPVCSGASQSLGIGSTPDDSAALAKQLGLVAKPEQVAS